MVVFFRYHWSSSSAHLDLQRESRLLAAQQYKLQNKLFSPERHVDPCSVEMHTNMVTICIKIQHTHSHTLTHTHTHTHTLSHTHTHTHTLTLSRTHTHTHTTTVPLLCTFMYRCRNINIQIDGSDICCSQVY